MFLDRYNISSRPKIKFNGVVTTAQLDWEIKELIEIYDSLQPFRVLEIGTQFGGTLYYWLTGLEEGATVANIDILQNMEPDIAEHLPERWASWAPVGVDYHTLIGRSDDPKIYKQVIDIFDDELDFLWIDALHTYKGAKYDFCTYSPLVRPGGIIALHDICIPSFASHIQVEKLWREIQTAGYITRELKCGAGWGGIGIVYV